jgi:hypothetical protein
MEGCGWLSFYCCEILALQDHPELCHLREEEGECEIFHIKTAQSTTQLEVNRRLISIE